MNSYRRHRQWLNQLLIAISMLLSLSAMLSAAPQGHCQAMSGSAPTLSSTFLPDVDSADRMPENSFSQPCTETTTSCSDSCSDQQCQCPNGCLSHSQIALSKPNGHAVYTPASHRASSHILTLQPRPPQD